MQSISRTTLNLLEKVQYSRFETGLQEFTTGEILQMTASRAKIVTNDQPQGISIYRLNTMIPTNVAAENNRHPI